MRKTATQADPKTPITNKAGKCKFAAANVESILDLITKGQIPLRGYFKDVLALKTGPNSLRECSSIMAIVGKKI